MTFWKLDTSRAFTEAITADRELEAKAATVEVGKIGEAAKLQKVNSRNRKLMCYKGPGLAKFGPASNSQLPQAAVVAQWYSARLITERSWVQFLLGPCPFFSSILSKVSLNRTLREVQHDCFSNLKMNA